MECCDICANYKEKPGLWLPYDSRPSHQELLVTGAMCALAETKRWLRLNTATDFGCNEAIELCDALAKEAKARL